MNSLEYWEECISEAAESCGLAMTPEQHVTMAEAVAGAHECYSMAFGAPDISVQSEIADLKRRLKHAEAAQEEAVRRVEDAARNSQKESHDRMAGQISRLQEALRAERESKRDPGFAGRYR